MPASNPATGALLASTLGPSSGSLGSHVALFPYVMVLPYSNSHEVEAWFSGLISAFSVAANGVSPEVLWLTSTGFDASVVNVSEEPGVDSAGSAGFAATRQTVYSVLPSRPVTASVTFLWLPAASGNGSAGAVAPLSVHVAAGAALYAK